MLDERVAQGRRGMFPHIEFDDGATARAEVVPEDTDSGRPVHARLGRHGEARVARVEEEVGVDAPTAGLWR